MPQVKVVSWDVYGTLIATHYDECSDTDNPLKLRPGALEILTKINSKGIPQCTCSDGNLENLKKNLKEAGINWIDFFDDLYKMDPQYKDFFSIFKEYKIKHENLLIIGDNYDIDIFSAKNQGCQALWVPEKKKYGVNPLPIDKIKEIIGIS